MSAVRSASVLAALLCIAVPIGVVDAELLLWGHSRLETVAPCPLGIFNDNLLLLIADAIQPATIVAFIDNDSTTSIANQKLPRFKQLVEGTNSVYMPENTPLALGNYSVVVLEGADGQKDDELAATCRSVDETYGRGNVLYLLLKQVSHQVRRRAVAPVAKEVRDGPVLYYAKGKAGLYTSLFPVLAFRDNGTDTEVVLREAKVVTADVRDQTTRLIITFSLEDAKKATLRFSFTNAGGYWSLGTLQLEYEANSPLLMTTTSEMVAPKGFSFHCSGSTVFRNGSTTLTLTNVQVQPAPIANRRFGDAYDCVNFTTIPIWSGMLVTAIIGLVLGIALMAIADIRTMDRFDDPKGKPLNIFVTE